MRRLAETAPKFSRNTLRLIICALRAVLNAALEDGLIESNPAVRMGRFAKSAKPSHQASAMTRIEAEKFLTAIKDVCPDWHPLFLTALRAGLRKGELIALKSGATSSSVPMRMTRTGISWSNAIGLAASSLRRRVRNRDVLIFPCSFVGH